MLRRLRQERPAEEQGANGGRDAHERKASIDPNHQSPPVGNYVSGETIRPPVSIGATGSPPDSQAVSCERLLEVCSRTHPGSVRTVNEDGALWDPALGLIAVADGMGGHNAGEVASRMAVDAL